MISAEEKARRKRIVDEAIHSQELDGSSPSQDVINRLYAFVRGENSLDSIEKYLDQKYGNKHMQNSKSIDDEPVGTYKVAPLIKAPMPFTIKEATVTKRHEYSLWLRKEIIKEHPKWAKQHGFLRSRQQTVDD